MGEEGSKGEGQAQCTLPQSLGSGKPTSSGRASWGRASHSPTRLHRGIARRASVSLWLRPRQVRGALSTRPGHRSLARGAAKLGDGGHQLSPFGSSSCPLYIHIEPEAWLTFNKSKPVSFFKIEISQVISLPPWPVALREDGKIIGII